MTDVRSYFRRNGLLWVGLAAFSLTVFFVNPLRETPVLDDWAYALTVQHLLETGNYELHDWAAANMPLQIYWGGLFARLLGYSFSSLRISTLFLVFLGLIAFYFLAMEHGLDHVQAGLLVLGLVGSPLVVRFSFSFMTDVPFLVCLIISLLLYARGIRLHSYPLMLLASVAASAAILTRQFGVALIAGVFLVWTSGKDRREQVLLFLTGLTLPIVAGLWQLSAVILTPNWGAQYAADAQAWHLANTGVMLINMLWRPTVILQYLALFSLPFVFLGLLAFAYELKRGLFHSLEPRCVWPNIILPAVLGLYILAGIAYARFGKHLCCLVYWLMPCLPWNFALRRTGLQRGLLTLVTLMGAILVARVFVLRYSRSQGWSRVPPGERLLDLVTFFLFIFHLVFFQIGDEYLLVFLPFMLIALARHLRDWLNRFSVTTVAACLAMLVASAMWTRGLLESSEAYWQAGEFLRSTGVQSDWIFGSWTWVSYYRFQDYVAEAGDRISVSDFSDVWLREQAEHAQFLITRSLDPPANERWEVLKELAYEDVLFRERRVYVVRRVVPASIAHPMSLRLGETVRFLGYDLDPRVVSAGGSLHLTLYWQALSEMDASYSVFTHVIDGQNRLWGQKDGVPGDGSLPTWSWSTSGYIIDEYEIPVQADAPSGEYSIEVGMYDLTTMIRLPVSDIRGAGIGTRILLEATPIHIRS